MSRLFRSLAHSMILQPTRWQELRDWVDDVVHRRPDWYWALKNYKRNFVLFQKLAYQYRSWDSHFSIEVFCKLLEDNARSCKTGWNRNSEKVYRRGMTAAAKLDRAYNYSIINDKAYMYIARKYKHDIDTVNRRLTWEGEGNKIVEAMRDIASKRVDQNEKCMKAEAWQYLHRYIEHFWD